ncbi:hypothetical protein [Daejeonella sp.]|jgi:hypothetical protein|uniref:hypothetical protein n=2 Tax=Daejeonella sp. TaxID=2805397 RepID=UPI003784040A
MKAIIRILFFVLVSMLNQQLYAQQKRLINYTEIGALIHSSTSLSENTTLNGFRTRTGITKLVSNHVGIGFALGTDNYRKPSGASYNTLPITINGSYFLKPDLIGLKLDVYGGYSPRLFDNFTRGMTAGAGLSYSFPVSNGLNLGLQTGYNYQKIDFPASYRLGESFDLGNIRLGIGLTFK